MGENITIEPETMYMFLVTFIIERDIILNKSYHKKGVIMRNAKIISSDGIGICRFDFGYANPKCR